MINLQLTNNDWYFKGVNNMKITYFNKEIWWQWAWNFWRVGIEVDFDIHKYKYFSLELYLLLFAIRLYFEWK